MICLFTYLSTYLQYMCNMVELKFSLHSTGDIIHGAVGLDMNIPDRKSVV